MSATTDTSPDSRRHVTAAEAALAQRLTESLHDADRLALELPALLNHIRWHQRDGMGAADRARTSWCWTHQRDASRCPRTENADGLRTCRTETVAAHSDPTGEAAIGNDQAAGDLREIERLVEQIIATIDRAVRLADRYPLQPLPPADVEATPGDDWCRCCWKDHRYCEPVAQKPDGKVRYAGLCRWCGEFLSANRFEPPTWLVQARHRGDRITPGMVARAVEDHRRTNPPKAGAKGRNRRRRNAAA